jgi:hypothetical protein
LLIKFLPFFLLDNAVITRRHDEVIPSNLKQIASLAFAMTGGVSLVRSRQYPSNCVK